MRNYQSILEQDYENYEIIYVNDGSTDNSLSILRDIESSNDRVQVIDISLNGGVANARNLGLNKALGKYIYFLDPDDYLLKDFFNKVLPIMKKTGVDMLLFGMKEIYPHREIEKKMTNEKILYKKDIIETFAEQYFKTNVFSVCNKIYDAHFLKKNNLFFPLKRIGEDAVFNINVYRYLSSMYIVGEIFYLYEKRQGSAMNSEPTSIELQTRFNTNTVYELNSLLNEEWNLKTNIPFYQRLDSLFSNRKYVKFMDISDINRLYFHNTQCSKSIKRFIKYSIVLFRSIMNNFWGD